MTPEQFAEIRARCEAATPGPWQAHHRHVHCSPSDDEQSGLGLEVTGPPEPTLRGMYACAADANFIAHSRADVPALLAYIAELEEAARWHYPPEMPTDRCQEYVVTMHHGIVTSWFWDLVITTIGDQDVEEWGWQHDVAGNEATIIAWQPLPEPAPKKEGTL